MLFNAFFRATIVSSLALLGACDGAVRQIEDMTGVQIQEPAGENERIRLARALVDGDGRPADPARGVAILREEAAKGNAEAQFLLGLSYRRGRGVAKDEAEALRWFERAARQNHPDALYLAGLAHYRGRGTFRDADAAHAHMARAARIGHAGAMYHLGVFHQKGAGVRKNTRSAVDWFEQSAAAGFPEAAAALGAAYSNGVGRQKDLLWGMRWYERAAAYGIAEAQFRFGALIAAGKGVPADKETGLFYLILADRNGVDGANRVVRALRSGMPMEAAARAQGDADRWQPVPAGTVKPEDRATLRFVQAALRELGFDAGPIDGIDGPQTRSAIARYRSRNGPGAGNRLDNETVQAIRNERRRRLS